MGDDRFDLDGKVALVTGAAGNGIGRATVEELLVSGAHVAVTDQSARRTGLVTEEFGERFGAAVAGWALEVSDRRAVDTVVGEVVERLGPIDVLVNNAGINVLGDAHDLTPDDWDQVLAVNLSAPWYLARAVLPSMRARRSGVIVNVGSVAAYASDALARGPYAASKAGLESLTRTIAGESGPFGVRCVGVNPGIIESPFMTEYLASATLKDAPVLGRLGRPEEVGRVIAFLASDAASYVTGETVTVGGGFKMRP
jgi:3-oxoacyl-[acyl-carrier protein] reductase